MGRFNVIILHLLVMCSLSSWQFTDAMWGAVGETWSWVGLHDEGHVPVHLSGRPQQVIDINRLRVLSNISGVNSEVSVSMRFKNLNEGRLYKKFTIRLGDTAMVSDFKIDHMGIKVSARKMSMTRTERLVNQLKQSSSTAIGVVMLRTTPYAREYDVYVFLSRRSSMTFELKYKEKLQAILSDELFEQIISVYPYQLVEDFQADVTINRPTSGSIDDVTAFWDSFSVSNMLADPWGLQREPLSIRPWNGGHRINLHPLSNEMQSPRTWQSDLIVFFRWDSRGAGFGFGGSSWSSDVSDPDEFLGSEFLFSYDNVPPTPSTTDSRHTTDPSSSVVGTTTDAGEIVGSGSLEESGSGNSENGGDSEQSFESSFSSGWSGGDGGISEGSGSGGSNSAGSSSSGSSSEGSSNDGSSSGGRSSGGGSNEGSNSGGSSNYDSSSYDSSSYDSSSTDNSSEQESDFHFENETNIVPETNEEFPYLKIYQKETWVEFNLQTFGEAGQSKVAKMFKRIMKKLFSGKSIHIKG